MASHGQDMAFLTGLLYGFLGGVTVTTGGLLAWWIIGTFWMAG